MTIEEDLHLYRHLIRSILNHINDSDWPENKIRNIREAILESGFLEKESEYGASQDNPGRTE